VDVEFFEDLVALGVHGFSAGAGLKAWPLLRIRCSLAIWMLRSDL